MSRPCRTIIDIIEIRIPERHTVYECGGLRGGLFTSLDIRRLRRATGFTKCFTHQPCGLAFEPAEYASQPIKEKAFGVIEDIRRDIFAAYRLNIFRYAFYERCHCCF